MQKGKLNLIQIGVCSAYIHKNDPNGDMLDFYTEYCLGEASHDSIEECIFRILTEWWEDIQVTKLTAVEEQIYTWLGFIADLIPVCDKHETQTLPIAGTDETITICRVCGLEVY